jgi:hypothetical protein
VSKSCITLENGSTDVRILLLCESQSLGTFLNAALSSFDVGFWTSAKARNAKMIMSRVLALSTNKSIMDTKSEEDLSLFHSNAQLAWFQEECDREGPGVKNFIKDLSRVWQSQDIKLLNRYNPCNTILIDDSMASIRSVRAYTRPFDVKTSLRIG